MGDRATTIIRVAGRADLHLYTHWHGCDQEAVVRQVLARRLRWDDPDYLARMIFSAMVAEDVHGETGYGISTSATESEYLRLVLVPETQTVLFAASDYCGSDPLPAPMSFADFVAADGATVVMTGEPK